MFERKIDAIGIFCPTAKKTLFIKSPNIEYIEWYEKWGHTLNLHPFLLLFVFGMQYDVLIANNELVKIVDPTLKGGGAKFNFSGLNLFFLW